MITPDQVEDLYDPDLSGSGLGVGKTFKVRYHQEYIQKNQLMVITPKPPESWTANVLKNLPRMKLSALVQRLLHKVEDNFEAVLLFPVDGNGEVKVLQPNWELGVGSIELPGVDLAPEPEVEIDPEQIQKQTAAPLQIKEETVPDTYPDLQTEEEISGIDIPEIHRKEPREETGKSTWLASELSPVLETITTSKAWSVISGATSSLGNGLGRAWKWILSLVGRMLPDEQILDLPSWTLSLIAVLVPLIMVVFGSVFYIKRGRNHLYQTHYTEAQTLLALADTQVDPAD